MAYPNNHHHLEHEDYLDDLDNPRRWSTLKKCSIACFVLVTAFVATFGTPIYVAGIPALTYKFHLSTTQAILPMSLYAYGLGIGALVATASSETFGRTIVYRTTIPLTFFFTILCAVTNSYGVLAAARLFAGLFSGPCLTVGVGIFNDLWDVSLERIGTSFAVGFVLFVIWATQVGPMASAALIQNYDWRYLFWVPALLTFILAICSFHIPETYRPEVERIAARKRGEPIEPRGVTLKIFLGTVGRPLHMLLVEPIVFPTGLVLAITQSVVFAYYVAYAVLFEKVYQFTQFQVGMAFAPMLVGSLLAIPVVAVFDKLTYQKARLVALSRGRTVDPELRLYPAMLGCFTLPASLFWLAWSGKPSVHWIVPCLSGALFGLSYVLNMLCLPIYNNDVYTTHFGASVLAASTFMRFTISASFPLFTPTMINKLTFPWAVSLLGFIAILMIPIPWAFFKWGPNLRTKSRYLRHLQLGASRTWAVQGGIWGATRVSRSERIRQQRNIALTEVVARGSVEQYGSDSASTIKKPGNVARSDATFRSWANVEDDRGRLDTLRDIEVGEEGGRPARKGLRFI